MLLLLPPLVFFPPAAAADVTSCAAADADAQRDAIRSGWKVYGCQPEGAAPPHMTRSGGAAPSSDAAHPLLPPTPSSLSFTPRQAGRRAGRRAGCPHCDPRVPALHRYTCALSARWGGGTVTASSGCGGFSRSLCDLHITGSGPTTATQPFVYTKQRSSSSSGTRALACSSSSTLATRPHPSRSDWLFRWVGLFSRFGSRRVNIRLKINTNK